MPTKFVLAMRPQLCQCRGVNQHGDAVAVAEHIMRWARKPRFVPGWARAARLQASAGTSRYLVESTSYGLR